MKRRRPKKCLFSSMRVLIAVLSLPGVQCPKRLQVFAEIFLNFAVVAAHMGGEDNYDETETFLLGKDIYLDTAFILRQMPVHILERFTRKHSMDRILFGSDSPWGDPAEDLEYFFSLPFLNQRAKEKIAGGNAAALLGL